MKHIRSECPNLSSHSSGPNPCNACYTYSELESLLEESIKNINEFELSLTNDEKSWLKMKHWLEGTHCWKDECETTKKARQEMKKW